MKKLIAIATMLASGAAVAVNSSNVFGILRVDSSQPETIISVPWIAADSVTADIKVADLVLTSNLTAGDMLYYYNGTTSFEYEAWVLQNDHSIIGNKIWVAVNSVSDKGITVGAHAGTREVSRGAALFLVRQNYNNEPIYLYGRHTTGAATTQVVAGSVDGETGKATPAYTLIAPALPNDVDINAVTMTGTPNAGDFIQTKVGGQLFYREVTTGVWKWCVETQKRGQTTYDASSEKTTIPHGQGCWYVSVGGAPKFTW